MAEEGPKVTPLRVAFEAAKNLGYTEDRDKLWDIADEAVGPPTARKGEAKAKPLKDFLRHPAPEELLAEPEPRHYLLTDARTGAGVLVRGRVGFLAAKGGTGKSWAVTELAIAVATGGTWLGAGVGWKAEQGRALLVMGEEDAPEMQRRLQRVARAAHVMDEASLSFVEHGVGYMPLFGQTCALIGESMRGSPMETDRAAELRRVLEVAAAKEEPYTLVVLDPVSRFAGMDTEKDNAAATRFIQVCETLCAPECGSPTVLLSHHFRKQGREEREAGADDIRGAAALVDGARWASVLEPLKRADGAPELLRLRIVKGNYAPDAKPLVLCRPDDGHGFLRVATQEEWARYGEAMGWKKEDSPDSLQSRILEAVKGRPGSASELARRLGARKEAALTAVEQLIDARKLRREGATLYLRGALQVVKPTSDHPVPDGSQE